MKAAILYKAGELPKYGDFPIPLTGKDEIIVNIKATSVKNIDRMRVNGTHYDSHQNYPTVVGVDGAGILDDGTRVFTGSPNGTMAEKVAVNKHWVMPIPDNVDFITAAAIPNPAISAWLSLEWKGQLKKGGKVLLIGATGITGKLAVQIAKHLGAAKVVAMGRNPIGIRALKKLGADVVISLDQADTPIKEALRSEIKDQPFDVIIDYLWGEPAELVLNVVSGHDINGIAHLTRYVQIGEMAGSSIVLPAAALRSILLEISGLGGGSIPGEILKRVQFEILPKIFELTAAGLLTIEVETARIENVETAWQKDVTGKRLVILI